MFKVNLYKYDSSQEANGYRGVGENDFSRFVSQGQDVGEDITQVLDTGEITLYGLPFQKAFDPETKFIIDIIEYNPISKTEVIVETLHRSVAKDMPNQPIISDDSYFDHHISFIEPSVTAQKRLVDNISTTYKLKDVNLEERPIYPDTGISVNIEPSVFVPERDFGVQVETIQSGAGGSHYIYHQSCGKYFELEGGVQITNLSGERFNNIYNNIEQFLTEDGSYKANFIIPKLAIMWGQKDSRNFAILGYASIDVKIEEFTLNDEENPLNVYTKQIISNSNLGDGEWSSINGWQERVQGEWLLERCDTQSNIGVVQKTFKCYYKKYTQVSASEPNYVFDNIPISPDRRYVVTISLHQFPDNFPNIANRKDWGKYTGSQPMYYTLNQSDVIIGGGLAIITDNPTAISMTARQTSGSAEIITWDATTKTIVYSSSKPYSALALLQKAIINSGLYEKENGVYIADVNNSNLPFYIDPNFIDELSATLIIENFYNQKNLWEIMVEVGNYIHAIPELKFGSNDRFMITFNRLGITEDDMEAKLGGKIGYEEKQKGATKLSIYNSRGVEDYISGTSSYISNMVQLGGYVEEWVVPKTSDETLLVANDTADIKVSKPIIELMEIRVRRNQDGVIRDFTNFVYEKNVYDTLSIDFDVVPNRGIALYYNLGENTISGGQFQLPQANTNLYTDYAIKKCIYSAFHEYPPTDSSAWTTLKVNDYSFFVRYRTKDSVRQNHIRPDLRKYLLSTKWDRYPEHNQFNNQTDVVVDSIKFGNNMFGKLIKTGNNSYDIYEWNDKWENVKHKGELYRLNGELYYIAKVMHTIYNAYVISKVSYSKDYNELSNIIGIPSEPRFYEISEQSLIWREFEINDILLLTDDPDQLEYQSNYVFNYDHLANLVIGEGTDFARYAITVFKGDKDAGDYDQTVGQKDFYVEIISPINAYSSENTLTYEYDMKDNYAAGDKVIDVPINDEIALDERAYKSLRAVGYTDIYGRASLMDFYILGNIGNSDPTSPSGFVPPTPSEIEAFPESPIDTKDQSTPNFIGNYDILATNVRQFNTDFNGRGLGLLKDCREAMSNNYNLRMATSSDTFVLSPYVYLPKKSNVRIVLLTDEVNKLSTGYIDNSKIITPIDKQGNQMNPYFTFEIDKSSKVTNAWGKEVLTQFGINLSAVFQNVAEEHFTDANGYQRVKAIAVLCDVSLNAGIETENPSIPYKTQFIVARNIQSNLTKEQALKSWIWGSPKKSTVFKNTQ